MNVLPPPPLLDSFPQIHCSKCELLLCEVQTKALELNSCLAGQFGLPKFLKACLAIEIPY